MSERNGLTLEEPRIQVLWGIRPGALRLLFAEGGAEAGLRLVTEGYYVARCRMFCGLDTQVGFHFCPQAEAGLLAELELFDNGQRDLEASYALYQRHLELAFGRPSRTHSGAVSSEPAWHEWRRGRVHVSHYVVDRFGPEERVRIVRKSWLTSLLA